MDRVASMYFARWQKDNSPCVNCTSETGRHPSCHTTCERYNEYKNRAESFKAELARSSESVMSAYVIKRANQREILLEKRDKRGLKR